MGAKIVKALVEPKNIGLNTKEAKALAEYAEIICEINQQTNTLNKAKSVAKGDNESLIGKVEDKLPVTNKLSVGDYVIDVVRKETTEYKSVLEQTIELIQKKYKIDITKEVDALVIINKKPATSWSIKPAKETGTEE